MRQWCREVVRSNHVDMLLYFSRVHLSIYRAVQRKVTQCSAVNILSPYPKVCVSQVFRVNCIFCTENRIKSGICASSDLMYCIGTFGNNILFATCFALGRPT